MTTKKFISGILALAMTASLLPVMTVQAETPPDSTYIYYEDFESTSSTGKTTYSGKTEVTDDYTGIVYDKALKSNYTDVWSDSIAKDGGNHYIKYTVTDRSKTNTSSYTTNVVTSGWAGGGSPTIEIDRNTTYEGGISVNVDDLSAGFNSVALFKIVGMWTTVEFVKMTKSSSGWDFKVVNGSTISTVDPVGFIDVKIFFNCNADGETLSNYTNRGTTTVQVTYTDSNGDTYTETGSGTFAIAHSNWYNSSTGLPGVNTNGRTNGFGGYAFVEHRTEKLNQNGEGFGIDNLYLKKYKTYTVEFDANYEGAPSIASKETGFDNGVTPPEITRDGGWAFEGWYQEEACENEFKFTDIGENSPLKAYANWVKIHTITFDAQGGEAVDDIITTLEKPEEIEVPLTTKEGYFLDGWYYTDGEDEIKFDGKNITEDMEVYAKWLDAFMVNYDGNGADLDRDYDWGLGYMPANTILYPEYEGYRFDGWYLSDGTVFWKPDMPESRVDVQEEISVEAEWTRKHVVSFELNGGTMSLDETPFDVSSDGKKLYTLENIDVADLPAPAKAGGSFEGWYVDKELTTEFDGTVTEDITLYAMYNNLLFMEDFEFENEEEQLAKTNLYLSQLSPESYESLRKQGGGIVEDPDDPTNHIFRVAGETGKTIKFSFETGNGGLGLYEAKFRIKNLRQLSIAKPSTGGSAWTQEIRMYGSSTLLAHDGTQAQISSVKDWVYFTVWYDTQNDIASIFVEWENIYGDTLTAEFKQLPINHVADGLDAILFGNMSGITGAAVTDTYLDDYVIRKIDCPTVESIETPNGSDIDVPLQPEIKVQFSKKMDRSTITTETIYLTDEDGNKVATELNSIHENEKTYATIKPLSELEIDTKYTVNVNINNTDGTYYLDKPYEYTFTTIPEKYQLSYEIVNEDGSAIEDKNFDNLVDLTDSKSGKVKLNLTFRNYNGDEQQKYYIGVALVDKTTGKQLQYNDVIGTIAKNESVTFPTDVVIDASGKAETSKIKIFIWDSVEDMNYLWDIVEY